MAWGKTSFKTFKPAAKSRPVTRKVTSYRPPTSPPQSERVSSKGPPQQPAYNPLPSRPVATSPAARTKTTVTSRAPAPKTAKNIVIKAPAGRVTSPIPAVTRPAVRVVPKSVIKAVTAVKTGAPSGGINTAKAAQQARAAQIAQGIQKARAASIASGIQKAAQASKAKTIANAVAATGSVSRPTGATRAPAVVKPTTTTTPTTTPTTKPTTTVGPRPTPTTAKPGSLNTPGSKFVSSGGNPSTFGHFNRKRFNRGPLTGESITPEELRRIAAQRIVNR